MERVWRVGLDDVELAAAVGELLMARGETVATAESCTGGLVGQLLTATGGSSAYYVGGVISYSNAAKIDLLGVDAATIATHGAVSAPTVIAMANGAKRCLRATWALSVSGVAGPGGGSPEKPVGTVHLGIAGPDATDAQQIFCPGTRDEVRQAAAHTVLLLLYKRLRS